MRDLSYGRLLFFLLSTLPFALLVVVALSSYSFALLFHVSKASLRLVWSSGNAVLIGI